MKTYTKETLARLMNDGFCEYVSEPTRAGYCELRWLACNKTTHAEVTGR